MPFTVWFRCGLFFILTFILLLSPTYAITNSTCFGNYSQTNTSQIIYINESATTVNTTESINCPFGCDNESGNCREIDNNSAFLPLTYAVIAFSFFYISTKIEGHLLLRTGFFVIGLTMITMAASIGLEVANTNIPTPFSGLLTTGVVYTVWVLRLGATYMLIVVFLELMFFLKKNVLDQAKMGGRRRRK